MAPEEQRAVSYEVLNAKIDHVQQGVDEIKVDVREIKNESPVWRIGQLEDRWRNLSRAAVLLFIAVIGAYLSVWFTR